MRAIAHDEIECGMHPRHPLVCIIDLIGFAITSVLMAIYEPRVLIAVLPIATMMQYVISIMYHWFPKNTWRQNVDHVMIAILIGATFVPYWGTYLSASEMLWRFPVLALFVLIISVLRCSSHPIRRKLSAGFYPALGAFGLTLSFNELQVWLPPLALTAFWVGMGLYFLQFIVWVNKKPDPIPEVFGYTEIQHVLILCGTTLQMVIVLTYL